MATTSESGMKHKLLSNQENLVISMVHDNLKFFLQKSYKNFAFVCRCKI